MSFRALVAALYNAVVGSQNVRYRQHPAGVALVQIADDAAWDQLFVAATIATDFWVAIIDVSMVAVTADFEEILAWGSGGADGAAIAAATLLGETVITGHLTGAAASSFGPSPSFPLPIPIRVPALTRMAARISASPVGGEVLGVGVTVATAIGT